MACPCCVAPTQCSDCCGDWPSELTVSTALTVDADFCIPPSISAQPAVLLGSSKSLTATVTLSKRTAGFGECARYSFNGCGVFGDFVQLDVVLVFTYSANKCYARATVSGTLCMCYFLGPTQVCASDQYCPGALRSVGHTFSAAEYTRGCGNLPCFDGTFTKSNPSDDCDFKRTPNTTTALGSYPPAGCGSSSNSDVGRKDTYTVYAKVCP
jgi:hypothetical protein